MAVLLLPALGIVVTFWRVGQRSTVAVWKRTEGHNAARAVFVTASTAAAAALAYLWWPNGEYRPIQKGEKGTVLGAVNEFENVSSGRPALTSKRARQLGDAPFRSKQKPSDQVPPTSTTPTGTTRTPTSTSTSTSTSSTPAPPSPTPTVTETTGTSTTDTTTTSSTTTTTP
jgi:hypothetical protein